ncbi:glutamate-5-semialdehyde dehydrogenase [Magnetofaba australis]|uniref:Gamma-glutamyl phosphate reductase n=1 Tax=Magnetofaba australis IT-1 TaxID=1434232 RepID=A0A1Y2K1Y3_9PROT|nr:glutamate-5-semialdehyde dehydrogenase [Magnetofaba australis]OSM01616.1 putative glutamate-5-semialdehyde dehydrogenase [Magnetofaba australis IT-1]
MSEAAQLIEQIGKRARAASRKVAWLDGEVKDNALRAMADVLLAKRVHLQNENAKDLEAGRANGLTSAMLDRLTLSDKVIEGMAEGIRQIAALPDPIGEITGVKRRPNGIRVGHMRVPLGVIGIIYESRPNVTADAAALAVKSGNAVILRGGSEAIHSNRAIAACLAEGLAMAGAPADAVQVVETTDRAAVGALLRADKYVDIIIPRGGKSLIQRVMEDATIPVIKHLDGVCHAYVDEHADLHMAEEIICNGKMQRTGVCNALETILIHQDVATTFLPAMAKRLHTGGCALRVCPRSAEAIGEAAPTQPATEADWEAEYLDAILAVRVVDSMDDAMDHIDQYGSRHTEVIITKDYAASQRFLRQVDAAAVMVNASSRFNDGFQFGLGAEMGISTDKLHVRGPVGLEGLTCQKWIVLGDGQVRS